MVKGHGAGWGTASDGKQAPKGAVDQRAPIDTSRQARSIDFCALQRGGQRTRKVMRSDTIWVQPSEGGMPGATERREVSFCGASALIARGGASLCGQTNTHPDMCRSWCRGEGAAGRGERSGALNSPMSAPRCAFACGPALWRLPSMEAWVINQVSHKGAPPPRSARERLGVADRRLPPRRRSQVLWRPSPPWTVVTCPSGGAVARWGGQTCGRGRQRGTRLRHRFRARWGSAPRGRRRRPSLRAWQRVRGAGTRGRRANARLWDAASWSRVVRPRCAAIVIAPTPQRCLRCLSSPHAPSMPPPPAEHAHGGTQDG